MNFPITCAHAKREYNSHTTCLLCKHLSPKKGTSLLSIPIYFKFCAHFTERITCRWDLEDIKPMLEMAEVPTLPNTKVVY